MVFLRIGINSLPIFTADDQINASMRKLNILFVFMISALTLMADNRISVFIGNANRYASVDLSDFRRRLCREYNMSRRALDDCYRWCGRNWGHVGIALEVARTSGRHIHDVCRYYKKYRRHGWNRVLVEIGICPGSHYYTPFYARLHHHGDCWHRHYRDYCRYHDRYYRKNHHHHSRHHHHNYYKEDKHRRYYDYDDDDDDDDDD